MLNEEILQQLLARNRTFTLDRVLKPKSLLANWREVYTRRQLDQFDDAGVLGGYNNRTELWAMLFDMVRGYITPDEEKASIELLRRKHHDYGGGSLIECGEFGVFVRGFDKIHRLKNIEQVYKDGGTAEVNESVQDTILDLFNYTILGYLLAAGGVTGCVD